MLELLFVIGFFCSFIVTIVSILDIIAALVMFLGGLFALTLKLLSWLLLAVAIVWIIRAAKAQKSHNIREVISSSIDRKREGRIGIFPFSAYCCVCHNLAYFPAGFGYQICHYDSVNIFIALYRTYS